MARPVKRRRICELPEFEEFVPAVKHCGQMVCMTLDEYETIRLIDYMGFSQEDCAKQMTVARTTVQAIYDSARGKIADVLVNGKGLKIGGGSYEICAKTRECCGKDCGRRGTKGDQCDTKWSECGRHCTVSCRRD